MPKTLHLFDFDGTLTQQDSLFAFLKCVQPRWQFWPKTLWFLPWIIFAKLGVLDKGKVKEKLLKSFLGKKTKKEIRQITHKFYQSKSEKIFRPNGILYLRKLKENQENRIFLVSASLDIWLRCFAQEHLIGLICTKAKFQDNRFVGFDGKNCNGKEKKARILIEIDLKKFDQIIAYGDKKEDYEMFSIADKTKFRPFHKD